MTAEIENARKELDKEFASFRKDLGKIHEALQKVEAAGPADDVSKLLEDLEDTVKKVRTGGILGAGAKGHKKALEAYLKASQSGR
jgi:hypothetical protein